MTPINIEVVTRLFNEMELALTKLRSSSELPLETFLSDSKYHIVKNNLDDFEVIKKALREYLSQ